MKWCCETFRGWFEHAGKRGIGVFGVEGTHNEPSFILQFRALDPDKAIPRTEYPLSSVLDVGIHFCPWCGANLEQVYRAVFANLRKPSLRIPLSR